MTEAASPSALSVRSAIRLHGEPASRAAVASWLADADMLTGGRTNEEAIKRMAAMVIDEYRHRSMEFIMLAIRDGMGSTDEEGKVYGSITWPKVALWLKRKEDQVMDMAADEHSRMVVKNDNVGKEYMDRLAQEGDTGTIDRQRREIDRLRNKLSTRKP